MMSTLEVDDKLKLRKDEFVEALVNAATYRGFRMNSPLKCAESRSWTETVYEQINTMCRHFNRNRPRKDREAPKWMAEFNRPPSEFANNRGEWDNDDVEDGEEEDAEGDEEEEDGDEGEEEENGEDGDEDVEDDADGEDEAEAAPIPKKQALKKPAAALETEAPKKPTVEKAVKKPAAASPSASSEAANRRPTTADGEVTKKSTDEEKVEEKVEEKAEEKVEEKVKEQVEYDFGFDDDKGLATRRVRGQPRSFPMSSPSRCAPPRTRRTPTRRRQSSRTGWSSSARCSPSACSRASSRVSRPSRCRKRRARRVPTTSSGAIGRTESSRWR